MRQMRTLGGNEIHYHLQMSFLLRENGVTKLGCCNIINTDLPCSLLFITFSILCNTSLHLLPVKLHILFDGEGG